MVREVIRAVGHEHVAATHTSTLELTTDDWLTPAGDCIVGIEASCAPTSFAPEFASACRSRDAEIVLTLEVGSHTERIRGQGHPELTFESERSLVVRTSEYVDDRTILVGANKAAADLDRELVAALEGGAPLVATIAVERNE